MQGSEDFRREYVAGGNRQVAGRLLGAGFLDDVRELGRICKQRALETRDMLCDGRTHGIHAEPMTFGMKFGAWAWALKRAEQRLLATREYSCAWGAISGAVGSYSNIDPFVESYVCEKLGLTPEPLSTQVIPRDRHAQFLAVLATVASARRIQDSSGNNLPLLHIACSDLG